MRIQELYNQYCKKEISIDHFLSEVRKDSLIKGYISPVNSGSDVILILKQKGLLSEQITEDHLIIQEKEIEDQNGEAAPESPEYGEELEEYADGDEEKYQEIDDKYGTDEVREAISRQDQLGFDMMGEAINAILLHRDWADRWDVNDPSDVNIITNWRKKVINSNPRLSKRDKNTELNEGKKPKLTADDVNYYEFTRGWRSEYEKNPKLQVDQNIDKAKEIALNNLSKDPNYYTNQIVNQTLDKQRKDPKHNKSNILKAPTDQTELKDKANQMKVDKKNSMGDKSNVKANLGNQEKAKGMPKGVKVMKLKESIRQELKKVLAENPLTKEQKSILKSKLNESEDLIRKKAVELIKASGSKEKAIEACDKAIASAEKMWSDSKSREQRVDAYKKIKAYLTGDQPVKADPNAFSVNERTTVGDFDTWKKSVVDLLKKALKTDDKASGKIFHHYEKDFKANHSAGKDPKTAVQQFAKGLKKVKNEEFEGNTAPEKADFQDVSLGSENEGNKLNESVYKGNDKFLINFESELKKLAQQAKKYIDVAGK